MTRPLSFSPEELAQFKRKGLVKLKQVITPSEVDALRRWCDEPIWTPDDPAGLPGFANTAYRVGTRQTVFEQLADDDNLRSALRDLTGEKLIYTNGNRFTLTPGASGSPWHFGRITFSYIEPLDPGYSIWIPLDPINVNDQHGGMAWVPEDSWTARGRFQMWAGQLRRGEAAPNREELHAAMREQFGKSRGFSMLGPYDRAFLEIVGETADFAVGDALVFSKFVWHRTEPLRAGKMAQRIALVLRYVSENATLARDLLEAATAGMSDQLRQEEGIFGSYLSDIRHGDLLRTSAHCPQPR